MARQEPVENEDFRETTAPGVVLAGRQQNSALGFMIEEDTRFDRFLDFLFAAIIVFGVVLGIAGVIYSFWKAYL